MNTLEKQKLIQRQSFPMITKLQITKRRIKHWYEYHDGEVYVAFSGGRDSTVLLDIVWSIYPDIPAVFSNTGLELREIKDFVKSVSEIGLTSIVKGERVYRKGDVIRVVPKKNFKKVIEEDGFALISKKQSKALRVLKQGVTPETENMYRLFDEGINSKGQSAPRWKLAQKWRYLIDTDIKISEKCCDYLKKDPTKVYKKETGRKEITGMMAEEGGFREDIKECNSFSSGKSSPMLYWTTEDVKEYIRVNRLRISKAYLWLKNENNELVEPENRTGCAFCMFGVHLEKGVNRFQKLYKRDYRMWDTAINKLGLKKPLDLINVKYIPDEAD